MALVLLRLCGVLSDYIGVRPRSGLQRIAVEAPLAVIEVRRRADVNQSKPAAQHDIMRAGQTASREGTQARKQVIRIQGHSVESTQFKARRTNMRSSRVDR